MMRLITWLMLGGAVVLPSLSIPANCDDRAGADQPPGTESILRSESWYALFVDDAKVGYRHVIEKKIEQAGSESIATIANEHIEIVREGERIVADVEIISREKTSGELIRVEYQLPLGQQGIRFVGKVDGRTLRLLNLSSKEPASEIPWPVDALGPFGIEFSLRKGPPMPHDIRTLHVFFPAVGQLMEVTLRAQDWETTKLLGGDDHLLRVDLQMRLPDGAEMASNLWIDQHGEIWKDVQKVGVTVTAYRTTRQSALAAAKGQPFDLFQRALIPLVPPLVDDRSTVQEESLTDKHGTRNLARTSIKSLHDWEEIEYELSTTQSDPMNLFRGGARQQIRSIASNSARLVVHADSLAQSNANNDPKQQTGTAVATYDAPMESDKKSCSLAPSNDPRIRQLAQKVLPNIDDPMRVASALGRLVYDLVEKKSYGQVFASATEVLDLREGDCTEHSILLVALCRARNIPARAAMGLVYSQAHQAFAYHMWTEVWTGKQWIGLDATRSDGRVGPAHLKMATSHLDGPTALTEMLTILQAVDGLKIRVVSMR